jgi:MFS family permease
LRLLFENGQFRILWSAGFCADLALITYFTIHGWLALQVSDSAFWVGATAGAGGLSMTMFSVFGGVLVDRFGRRNLVLLGLSMRFIFALVLVILIMFDNVRLWHVIAASFGEGLAGSFLIPAMMAMTLDVAGKSRLLSATAARFAGMTVAGMIAPLVAGLVVNSAGIGWAYTLITGGYLASLFIMLILRVPKTEKRAKTSPIDDLRQGVSYVFRTPLIRTLIGMIFVTEAFGWAHESMLPVMARDVLDAGASGLGYMLAAGFAGATVSTVLISNMGEIRNKSNMLIGGCLGFGLFLVFFSWSQWLMLSMAFLAGAYASVIVYETTINTMLQTLVPDELRGRVLSFQTMMWGVTGLAGFHTGAIASARGAPMAIALGAVVVILNTLRIARHRSQFDVESAGSGIESKPLDTPGDQLPP